MSNKSYRVKYDFNNQIDHLKINLNQKFDFLQVLSLNITQEDAYKLYTSNYGVLVGRVLANDGFGIPNAKISIFLPTQNADDSTVEGILYPYLGVSSKNSDGLRYNLLPSEKVNECHQNVGSFPTKRLILDNDNLLEVFDKYYKYTTRTNESGDYMIFGVPVGIQQVHVDIDLSDIGVLSQAPRDFTYKGYNLTQFESPNKFKKSKDLDSLSQIISQNTTVYVYPFWGDETHGEIAISKKDINIQYKFEPTCVFIGSIFTDSEKSYIGKTCTPTSNLGKMDELVSSQGSIEMIRKRVDGKVEKYDINGTRLINNDGVWCYQIPMNLDYVVTDEYGNLVPTTDPTKGIPTRTSVRFKITLDDNGNEDAVTRTGVYLIPNNPHTTEEEDYNFNEKCKSTSYVDLMWNKVYSVKNYIPRIQKGDSTSTRRFMGLKSVNNHGSNNPSPYNNIWIDLNLRFIISCALVSILTDLVGILNNTIHNVHKLKGSLFGWIPFVAIRANFYGEDCAVLGEKEYFVPFDSDTPIWAGDDGKSRELLATAEAYGVDINDVYKKIYFGNKAAKEMRSNIKDCAETSLSGDNEVINFDFSNDWLNGSIYAPRFRVKIKKDRRGNLKKHRYCGSRDVYTNLNLIQTCAPNISPDNTYDSSLNSDCENKDCYKEISTMPFNSGIVKLKDDIYYYKAGYYEQNVNINKYVYSNATGVILIGSLNENDLDGIPKLHQLLPSTSFKLPPESSESEINVLTETKTYKTLAEEPAGFFQNYYELDQYQNPIPGALYFVYDTGSYYRRGLITTDYTLVPEEELNKTETSYQEIVGEEINLEASGIDWGNKNVYEKGLFTSIKCFNSDTIVKTCINASRICEVGVDFDEYYEYNGPDGVTIKNEVDGYVSTQEISDGNVRNMFATLNSNKLKTEENDYKHLKYKFKYLFPSGFDGRMIAAGSSIGEPFDEDKSEDYMIFRNGPDSNEYKANRFKRFEDSFYFFFGIKNGSTAIDLFNNQYFVPCADLNESSIINTVSFNITKTDSSAYNAKNGLVKVDNITNTIDDYDKDYIYSIIDSENNTIKTGEFTYANSEYTISSELGIGNYSLKIEMKTNGLVYGSVPFSINSLPFIVTTNPYGITKQSAYSGGQIISNGNLPITKKGLCYSTTNQYPTINDTVKYSSSKYDTFDILVEDLNNGSKYYVRSFAENEKGTSYGEVKSFTAFSITTPSMSINTTYTDGEGIIKVEVKMDSDGGNFPNTIGLCWNDSGNPTTGDAKIEKPGSFIQGSQYYTYTFEITDITVKKLYYFKAYAINSVGIGYSSEKSYDYNGYTKQKLYIFAKNNKFNIDGQEFEGLTFLSSYIDKNQIDSNTRWYIHPKDNITINITGATSSEVVNTSFVITGGTSEVDESGSWKLYGYPSYIFAYNLNKNHSYGIFNGEELRYDRITNLSMSYTNTSKRYEFELHQDFTNELDITTGVTISSMDLDINDNLNFIVSTSGITSVNTVSLKFSDDNFATDNVTGITDYVFQNKIITFNVPLMGQYDWWFKVLVNSTIESLSYYYEHEEVTDIQIPKLSTEKVTEVTSSTARSGGIITSKGGEDPSVFGVCWNKAGSPTITDNKTEQDSYFSTDYFKSYITNLSSNEKYYVRAYATNSAGTGYGIEETFTTNNITKPTITTSQVSNITHNSANSGGNITSDGGGTITERGVCWAITSNPTIDKNKSSDGTGAGSFTSTMSELYPSTVYYCRAYATNLAGTSYGNEYSFTTNSSSNSPMVNTLSISEITITGATCSFDISSIGGLYITDYGVCWSTNFNPTINNNKKSLGSGGGPGQTYYANITGLSPGTKYYVRAYARNSYGIGYGINKEFETIKVHTVSFKPYDFANGNVYFNSDPVSSTGESYLVQDGNSVNISMIPNEGLIPYLFHYNQLLATGDTYSDSSLTSDLKNLEVIFYNEPPTSVEVSFEPYEESFGTVYFAVYDDEMPVNPAGHSYTVPFNSSIYIRIETTSGYGASIMSGPVVLPMPYIDNSIRQNLLNLQVIFYQI